jgi:hypothetical protein
MGDDMGPGQTDGPAGKDASPDLTGEPMAVTGLPQNCPPGVTAQQLYEGVVGPTCAVGSGCHATGDSGAMLFSFGNAADMKRRWVNNASMQATRVVRIKPYNIDQSYVMYKLMGQQHRVGGSGVQMPKGGRMLSSQALCMFVSWINEGAN